MNHLYIATSELMVAIKQDLVGRGSMIGQLNFFEPLNKQFFM